MAASNSELGEEIAELRKEVLEYVPGKASKCPERVPFPDNLYIGLFGRTGCGKTSLINSLKFAAHGCLRRAKWLQVATQEKGGGHTMFRKFADITERIYVIDNRGLDNPKTEAAITELVAQLGPLDFRADTTFMIYANDYGKFTITSSFLKMPVNTNNKHSVLCFSTGLLKKCYQKNEN